jgi:hypothetical protein
MIDTPPPESPGVPPSCEELALLPLLELEQLVQAVSASAAAESHVVLARMI